jgi:hypothetical protein
VGLLVYQFHWRSLLKSSVDRMILHEPCRSSIEVWKFLDAFLTQIAKVVSSDFLRDRRKSSRRRRVLEALPRYGSMGLLGGAGRLRSRFANSHRRRWSSFRRCRRIARSPGAT